MAEPVEHRLALVLNGGISLAVWMGGVAQEIDDLRRASSGIGARSTGPEQELLRLWKQAADAGGETITVDVIGGTSAGGLNGVFFAAAIARGATMEALRSIWMKDAQLSSTALLRPQVPTSSSLLNGDFFLEAIAASLDAIGPESPADARKVSLTTTASAFAGLPRVIVDSYGNEFAQSDHRRRYRFEDTETRIHYRQDAGGAWTFESEDGHHDLRLGDPVVLEALSRAGRATASIPGVFEPVRETDPLRSRRVWPTWPTAAPDDSADEWLLDGGLLDNSPFTPVLELVAKQSVASTWKRTVCYIAPDAAMPDPPAAATAPAGTPPPWDLAVSRLQSFPGEVSFRDDMDLLGGMIRSGRANEDIERFERLIADPAREVDGPNGLAPLAEGLLPLYKRSRAAAALLEAVDVVNGGSTSGLMTPTQLLGVEGVAASGHPWLPAGLPTSDAGLDEPWLWGLAGADRLGRLLLHALRTAPGATDARVAVNDVLHRIAAVRIAVEAALHDDAPSRPWRPDHARAVASVMDGVYSRLDAPRTLGALVRTAATSFAATRSPADDGPRGRPSRPQPRDRRTAHPGCRPRRKPHPCSTSSGSGSATSPRSSHPTGRARRPEASSTAHDWAGSPRSAAPSGGSGTGSGAGSTARSTSGVCSGSRRRSCSRSSSRSSSARERPSKRSGSGSRRCWTARPLPTCSRRCTRTGGSPSPRTRCSPCSADRRSRIRRSCRWSPPRARS